MDEDKQALIKVWSLGIERARELIAALPLRVSHSDLVGVLLNTLHDSDEDEVYPMPHRVIYTHRTPDYQGRVVSLLADKYESNFWAVTSWFGSCASCDAIEAACEMEGDDRVRALLIYINGLANSITRI
jgi:hypothetical protein